MKTKEELNALKNEVESLNAKLAELSDDELAQVAAGYHSMPKIHEDEKYVMLTHSDPHGLIDTYGDAEDDSWR